MTDQLAIDVPLAPAPRPVVIPPGAVRCWVDHTEEEDDGYPSATHWETAAAMRKALGRTKCKPRELDYVCVVAACNTCQVQLVGEYPGTLHLPNWAEAERVAQCDGWAIGDRGEFHCPECQEGR